MATHPSILAWRTPWTEEPGGLQSTGSQRVGHDQSDKQQQQCCYEQDNRRGLLQLPLLSFPSPLQRPEAGGEESFKSL